MPALSPGLPGQVGRPLALSADKIEYARLLRGQGQSYGQLSAKTSIPRTSLHRYLASRRQPGRPDPRRP